MKSNWNLCNQVISRDIIWLFCNFSIRIEKVIKNREIKGVLSIIKRIQNIFQTIVLYLARHSLSQPNHTNVLELRLLGLLNCKLGLQINIIFWNLNDFVSTSLSKTYKLNLSSFLGRLNASSKTNITLEDSQQRWEGRALRPSWPGRHTKWAPHCAMGWNNFWINILICMPTRR